ncbi:MAG: penicillin-binding protein 2 [Anaerolineales bacterium]|nr:penicillin-binding protein 2 [Anaerolineales bacterium]
MNRRRRSFFSAWRFSRDMVFYLLLALTVAVIIGRLFVLQVVDYDQYLTQADENRITRLNDPAPRGVIYDRRGVLLARNLPSFVVTITPAYLPDIPAQTEAILRRLGQLLQMPLTVPGSTPKQPCAPGRGIQDLVTEGLGFQPFSAVKIKCDIDQTTAFQVRQEIANLPMPGVAVIVEPVREYPTGALTADLVGYMAPIPSLESAPLTYDYYVNERNLQPNRDRIGVQGVEASLQDILAGQNGSQLIEVDVGGQRLRTTAVETETVPGLNVQLTVDVRLQSAVEAVLLKRLQEISDYTGGNQTFTSGVVIVMNPNTGEVLAMVSWPTYDNNKFARNIDLDYYASLVGDATRGIPPNPDYPMLNHAVQILYPPGSVFKLVTATGALEDKVIDPERKLNDPGKITIRNKYFPADPGLARDFVCWIYKSGEGHGDMDFVNGIANSCNVYFYKIGGGYEPDNLEGLGDVRLAKWMEEFGFGQSSQIELPAEQAGFIPTRDWKRRTQGESWTTGDTYNAVIGQGFVQVTPLQMLNAYNAVINGGRLLQPQVVSKILDGEGNVISTSQPVVLNTLPVAPENLALVRAGLRLTATDGTLAGPILYGRDDPIVDVPGINVAGKTGTAEYCDRLAWSRDLCIPGKWPAHAWTVMYAPYEAPEVSVIAFVYNGTEGSIVAGPVANAALRAYFQIIKGVDFETETEAAPATPR